VFAGNEKQLPALKRCQPDLGSLQRKTGEKLAGSKKGQNRKPRVVLPKENPNLLGE